MSAIRLSVCIPVYNFGAFLGETLESIVPQATEAVEIVVLDGGSTDDTPEVVGRFQERFPRLHYVRREKKGGIDRDMAFAVEAARGEYVWLFSGDDRMRPDAIERVLAALSEGTDIHLLESMLCRFDMTPVEMHRLLDLRSPRTFRLQEPADRREYFELALNTAAFFSFCSALVIRKARWDAAEVDESFDGSCWAHAARLASLIPSGLSVHYLPGAFLDKRGDNDSFLTNGLTHRFGIAVDGYHRIADRYFGHSSAEAFFVRRALRRELPWWTWLAAKLDMAQGTGRADGPEFRRLVRKQFSDPSLANLLARSTCLLTPVFALRLARRLLGLLRRLAGRTAPPEGAARNPPSRK